MSNPFASPITFYTHPKSRGCVVRWMLEETGLPYSTEALAYGGTMKAPAYLAINPMGKVPTIRHGDVVVTEVAAICLYLADLMPAPRLAPAVGQPARGAYYRWISFMAPLEQLMIAKASGTSLPDPVMAGFGTEAVLLDTLEAALTQALQHQGGHLAGDHFSAADLMVAAYLGWYLQFKVLPARDAFVRFASLHAQRPAALRGREKDAALLASMPAD